jgi:hypothetical protein
VSVHALVFIAGLLGVPILLLTAGRRLRHQGPAFRGAFWGAVIGHCTAALLALAAGMVPPEAWRATDTLRGFAGLWSLASFPLAGAIVGALAGRGRREEPAPPR